MNGPHYRLRMMETRDVPQVVAIDEQSFATPWSAHSYLFEIVENLNAHMVTLVDDADPEHVIGYGGLWLIAGEAHISTIAVHPDRRGQSFGEILLAGMLHYSLVQRADYSVLEVRVSNFPAINLYRKYEFAIIDRRLRYYRDTNEDAFMMYLGPMDASYRARFAERLAALQVRIAYTDTRNLHLSADEA